MRSSLTAAWAGGGRVGRSWPAMTALIQEALQPRRKGVRLPKRPPGARVAGPSLGRRSRRAHWDAYPKNVVRLGPWRPRGRSSPLGRPARCPGDERATLGWLPETRQRLRISALSHLHPPPRRLEDGLRNALLPQLEHDADCVAPGLVKGVVHAPEPTPCTTRGGPSWPLSASGRHDGCHWAGANLSSDETALF